MTDKRFTVNYRENTRLYEVKDRLHKIDCGSWVSEYGAKQCCKELNELAEENNAVKDIINELNSMDFYKDSALLDEYIGKIAKILGVDYE